MDDGERYKIVDEEEVHEKGPDGSLVKARRRDLDSDPETVCPGWDADGSPVEP